MEIQESIKEGILEDVKKLMDKGRTEIEVKIKPSGTYIVTAKA